MLKRRPEAKPRAFVVAEGVGFEPTVPNQVRRITSPVQSTALPPLHGVPLRMKPPSGGGGSYGDPFAGTVGISSSDRRGHFPCRSTSEGRPYRDGPRSL